MIRLIKKAVAVLMVVMLSACEDTVLELGFSENIPAVSESATPESEPERVDDGLFHGIVASLEDMSMTSEYSYNVSADEVEKTLKMINEARPEFFWVNGYTVSNSAEKSVVQIDPINNLSVGEIETMYGELVAAADEIIGKIPQYFDEYDAVVFVHDYLINICDYDTAGAASGLNGLYGTAYGCLVQGSAVCQGYAEAFQYIMNRMGINSGICRGTTARGRHAWNYVKIGEKYYWIDVTWDDPVYEYGESGTIRHAYCLLNSERMLKTRTPDPDAFMPNCYYMDDNYYVRNRTFINQYSASAISDILSRYEEKGEVEILFADDNAYNDAKSRLFGDGEIWVMVNSESVSYTEDDTMKILTIRY